MNKFILTPARVLILAAASSTMTMPEFAFSQSETKIPKALVQMISSPHSSPAAFVVDKEARTLTIWETDGENLKKLAEYPTDIGKSVGAKLKTGDHKTPEGIYFFNDRKSGKELLFDLYGSLAFTTDYPNHFDQLDGKTGYGIWLHGIPDSVPLTRGSRGCVVVRNAVIQEVEKYIKVGQTPILIFGKVDYVSADQRKEFQKKITDFIESWRAAWQSQNIDQYIAFYDSSFKSQGMNQRQWKTYKEGLKKKYEFIKVGLTNASILNHGDQFIIRALQNYSSDQFSDFGQKTLFVRQTKDGF
ncbi:MAG: murein L,D-transpeptidase family protein, partial [Pseudobdellovibrionaceae bacterium]